MNGYALLVLLALAFEHALLLLADLLNLRSLRPELPGEVRHVYDPARYARSQQYARERTRFELLARSAGLALLLSFWFAGGFAALDRGLRGLALGPVSTGLLFVGSLALGRALFDLPFRWYATFALEERYGFNRTRPRTFWADLGRGLFLAVALGGPLLAAILWLFERAGESAWLWCWGATALFTLAVQRVAPTWILPLFNRFTPLPEGELRTALLRYAERVGFPIQGLFAVDGSRRSTRANAFFTGFGRRKRVALFDTLIARHPTEELVAIVAHEIGHQKRGHVLQGMLLAILQAGVVFLLMSLLLGRQGLYTAFFVEERSVHAGLVFFSLLYAPIDLVLSLFHQALSRRNEVQADAFARETTGAPEPLVSALERLAAENLANLTPHPLYVKLHHSHPPLLERIRALRAG
jgi:STE24 endopeptidase